MKKIITALICSLFLILPFAIIGIAAFKIPVQYDETFVGELSDKHSRLQTTEGERIILIGGSNLAFGIDSALLEQYTGKTVVNYGLYASLGTKAMLDMSEKYIREGDIVVICPETNEQTYSLYYNADSMLQAYDTDPSMLADAKISNAGKLIGALPNFAAKKLEFYNSGTKPAPGENDRDYVRESFDEYGDIKIDRPYLKEGKMDAGYDMSMPISFSVDIIGEGFLDYLNDYAKKAEKKGAKVYFSFSPMNVKAVEAAYSDENFKINTVLLRESKESFYKYLGENLDFPIISNIDSYILHQEYFYDTNFHLTNRGALLRTALLADDILRETGNTEYVETVKYKYISRPKPKNEGADSKTENENAKYFEYQKMGNGLVITGLSDEGKKQKKLTVPNYSDGTAVIAVGSEAFAGTSLETLVIPSDSKIGTLNEKAFSGCKGLKRIEVYLQPSELTISSKTFEGMNSSCHVYIPADNYGAFSSNYFWGGMMKYVKQMD